MTDPSKCAHLMVVRRFRKTGDNPTEPIAWWECVDCRRRFVPVYNGDPPLPESHSESLPENDPE